MTKDREKTLIFRGGGWYIYVPSWVRSTYRNGDVPAFRFGSVGFRCKSKGQPRSL